MVCQHCVASDGVRHLYGRRRELVGRKDFLNETDTIRFRRVDLGIQPHRQCVDGRTVKGHPGDRIGFFHFRDMIQVGLEGVTSDTTALTKYTCVSTGGDSDNTRIPGEKQ